jgi:hypothetical protein
VPGTCQAWFDDRYFSFQRGGGDTMQYLSSPVQAKQNLHRLEEILYDLPPLEGVFLHWHTYGTTPTTPGILSLLSRRRQLLGPATLSAASLQLLAACATDSLRRFQVQEASSRWDHRPLHARVVRHSCALSAAKTQALLPPGVLVHKTVSVALADSLLLCTGAGTQHLKRWQLQAVASALALPRQVTKQCDIHTAVCDCIEAFAIQPALVSPFLPPSSPAGLAALVLSPGPTRCQEQAQEVAISLSLWESLLLPIRCLRPLIRRYAARAYPEVPVLELESEGPADEYTETTLA